MRHTSVTARRSSTLRSHSVSIYSRHISTTSPDARRIIRFACITALACSTFLTQATTLAQSPAQPERARDATPLQRGRTDPRSLLELQTRILEITHESLFDPAFLSVKVMSLDTGRTLYEENADKLMSPASNMKLYTLAAALNYLSPDFRFKTSAYASQRPDSTGRLRGALIIYGRGDPSFSASFNDGDYRKAIDEMSDRIKAAGVRIVDGDMIGDEGYFTGQRLAPGWAWEDTQWYYGVEVSALSIGDNAIAISLKPGPHPGDAVQLKVEPETPLIRVLNHVVTTARSSRRDLRINRRVGENLIEISGTMPEDDPGYSDSISLSHSALLFATLMRSSLERRGIKVLGRTRAIDASNRAGVSSNVSSMFEIASRDSPPLGVIAARTLKPSQNLYAELILRALGQRVNDARGFTSAEAGLHVIKQFLREAHIDAERPVLLDGSGLSRGVLLTTDGIVQLLVYMSHHRYWQVFRDALPLAGVDGTLRNRFKGTAAAGNARAKTGAIGATVSLSGYVNSAVGERLAFSLIINNTPLNADARADFTDAVTVLLASFEGHS